MLPLELTHLFTDSPTHLRCSAESPERRLAPPRCSDVSFIVKHLPRAVDPETALHSKPNAPTQGGWPREIPQFPATDDEASA
jgi:hypothetical protein